MPPRKKTQHGGDAAHGGKKRGTTVKHGKGKGHKKKKPGTPQKDNIDDLFPSLEKRFPLDHGETDVNPDFPTSYFHQVHENDDVHAIDFKDMAGHLPTILGERWRTYTQA